MFGLPFLAFLSPYALFVKIGLVLLAVAAAAWAWHLFVDHYREQGRGEVRKEYQAVIAQCDAVGMKPNDCAADYAQTRANLVIVKGNFDKLTSQLKDQNAKVEELTAAGARSQAATKVLLAALAKQAKASDDFVTKLRTASAVPAATKEKECEQADAISIDAAARRVQFFSGSTPGAGSQDGGGAKAGTGTMRISK